MFNKKLEKRIEELETRIGDLENYKLENEIKEKIEVHRKKYNIEIVLFEESKISFFPNLFGGISGYEMRVSKDSNYLFCISKPTLKELKEYIDKGDLKKEIKLALFDLNEVTKKAGRPKKATK